MREEEWDVDASYFRVCFKWSNIDHKYYNVVVFVMWDPYSSFTCMPWMFKSRKKWQSLSKQLKITNHSKCKIQDLRASENPCMFWIAFWTWYIIKTKPIRGT